ncbi:MAG: hypothetical protein H0U35_13685 [Sporichthyaceae bacterium]|nr:hypothetical protein [Sporichthyaceae bacterium]
MRLPRTLGELDDLVSEADVSGRGLQLTERLLRAADSMPHGEESLRAEMLVAAAEGLSLSGQPQRAVAAAQAAVADGGPVRHDARTHLAAALRGAGRDEEARATLREVWRSRPRAPGLHLFAGEQSEAIGDHAEALRWYTRGLSIAENKVGDEEAEVTCMLMLIARLRTRRALALPPDDWDLAAVEAVESARRVVEATEMGDCDCPCGHGAVISEEDDAIFIDLVRA